MKRFPFIATGISVVLFFLGFGCRVSVAADVDLRTVYFKPGLPSMNGRLEDALGEGSLDILGWNAELMAKSAKSKVRFEIIGATDSSECSGAACVELSRRRAVLVHDWLVARGVPVGALTDPKGIGTQSPIADDSTPDGRARNRHVEFGVLIPE